MGQLGAKEDVNGTALHHTFAFGPFSAVSTPQIARLISRLIFQHVSRCIKSRFHQIYIPLHLSKFGSPKVQKLESFPENAKPRSLEVASRAKMLKVAPAPAI